MNKRGKIFRSDVYLRDLGLEANRSSGVVSIEGHVTNVATEHGMALVPGLLHDGSISNPIDGRLGRKARAQGVRSKDCGVQSCPAGRPFGTCQRF